MTKRMCVNDFNHKKTLRLEGFCAVYTIVILPEYF